MSDTMTQSAQADPAAIVDALKAVAGNIPKVRASFAKGQCVVGTYTPSEQAKQVTRSPNFTQPSTLVGRFSIGGGNPAAADTNKAVLRGFAFRLVHGNDVSTLLVENAPVHFARTMNQMLAFLKARAPGADGKPDPEKIKAFSDVNPETLNQAHFAAAHPLPGSFMGITYWGVHAFPVTNTAGHTRFVKFAVVPADGEVTLTEAEGSAMTPDFLHRDLEKRILAKTARLHVLAILDRPGDPVMDVTIRWADEDRRETVRLGTINITSIQDNETCDETIFDPGILADGVGYPPDEMFEARRTAYAISLSKRRN